MPLKCFTSIMIILMISLTASSQSIYQLEYSFPNQKDTIAYRAFFVRYDDGSGFVRVKYKTPDANDSIAAEMNIQEEYALDKNGNTDTNRLVYKTAGADISPVFWFAKNASGENFEPVAVSATAANTLTGQAHFSKAMHVKAADLEKNFVLQFFKQEEDFYQNLFTIKSRGQNTETAKIFLLVVANTNDPDIGGSCYKDMNRVVYTYQDLAEFLGIEIFPTKIFGTLYSKENIEKAINDIKPSKDDIVIFYYSGHGFRKKNDKRRYPYLDFRAKPKDDYKVYSMNIEDIFHSITKKGARFNLVLSDCCNNDPESTNAVGTMIPGGRGPSSSGLGWNEDNCRALFLNKKRMSVLATAADVGQRASSNNDFGGFFSYFFKTSMENHFSVFKKNITWEQVMDEAKKQTVNKAEHTYCDRPFIPANVCKQFPFYDIKY